MKNKHSEKKDAQDKKAKLKKTGVKEVAENKQECEVCPSLMEQLLRARAEFDNARKRWERDRTELVKYANFGLLQELISFMDVMDQALKTVNEHSHDEQVIKGVELMRDSFISLLNKKNVEGIDVKGKPFDPHTCEMLTSREVDSDKDDGVVLEVIQKGYKLDGRVLRTAKVIVGMKKQEPVVSAQVETNLSEQMTSDENKEIKE